MTRRELLKYLGYMGSLMLTSSFSYASLQEQSIRRLNLYSLNTGDRLRIVYWADGVYLNSSLEEINYLLRDYRSGQVAPIDIKLLDLLHLITKLSGKEDIVVISGYRSPSTNNYLHKTKKGVAKDSYHTLGRAVDVRIEGISLEVLKDIALSLGAGGVGFYPKSGFVHLDTGPRRYWVW